MPSDRYWEQIKTQEDYNAFIKTGMAWELEPDCPDTWTKHVKLKAKLFCERVEKAHKNTNGSKLRFGGKNNVRAH